MKRHERIQLGIKRREKSLQLLEGFCKGKILDIGSNQGATTNYLHELGFAVEGIEINKKTMLEAKKRYPQCTFIHGDATKKLSKTYDTILLIGVLEEIHMHPVEFLKKLKTNLSKKGRIIIAVRNMNSLKRRMKTLLGMEPVDTFENRLWMFTKRRLLEVVAKAGYKPLKVTSTKKEVFGRRSVRCPDGLAEELWAIIRLR